MKNKAKMMMKFEANQQADKYTFYLYDDVTKAGTFDWSTWEYVESKTSAKYFADQLAQIPANAEIEIFINSNGGSVSEGTAIYNQLKRHPAHKTGYVDGCAYSVASLILQACDKRIMGLGTSMLVHNMWVYTAGNAQMLRSMADDLDHWMEANRKIYLEHAGGKIQEAELIQIMDEEKILTPDDALAYGFIDEIDSDSDLTGADTGVEPVQLSNIQTILPTIPQFDLMTSMLITCTIISLLVMFDTTWSVYKLVINLKDILSNSSGTELYLSQHEQHLIEAYRFLDETNKEKIDQLLTDIAAAQQLRH